MVNPSGVDVALIPPLTDPSPDGTTISFSSVAVAAKEEEEKISISSSGGGFVSKNEKIKDPVTERCPDLNLELRISPPYQAQTEAAPLKKGGRSSSSGTTTLYFACSLGIQNTKECSCSTIGTSSGSTSSRYDFLGLKSGFLDIEAWR